MSSNARVWGFLCLLAALLCAVARPADLPAVSLLEAFAGGGAEYADVTFTTAVEWARVRGARAQSSTEAGRWEEREVASWAALGGRPRQLRVMLAAGTPPAHTLLRVCVSLETGAGQPVRETCGQARWEREAAAELRRALDGLSRLPKTEREKSVLASVYMSRQQGSTVGSADISLVRSDAGARDVSYFVRLKRGSLAGMDPHHMEAGGMWRRSILMHRAERALVRKALRRGDWAGGAGALQELQSKWFAGHTVEVGVKLEGDASGVNRWLGLVDAGWGLQSTTRRVNLPDAPGWFRFRLLAAGVEAGREQARVKWGAGAALMIAPREQTAPIRRWEFTAEAVGRWLARPEWGRRGVRAWLQADAKAFFAGTGAMRYGLRLSLQRGALPPLFAPVNSVQLGFVAESAGAAE